MPPSFQKGFTLLLSILVISMILSASLGMAQIALKENQLSSLVRESESAFHAADKGIDCALYYHISYDRYSPGPPHSPFSTSSVFELPSNMNTVTCNGTRLDSVWTQTNPAPAATTGLTTFWLNFADGSCVYVEVLNYNSNTTIDSTIKAEGYNTCVVNAPNRTLRVIEVTTNL
jgi:hypothetical protein